MKLESIIKNSFHDNQPVFSCKSSPSSSESLKSSGSLSTNMAGSVDFFTGSGVLERAVGSGWKNNIYWTVNQDFIWWKCLILLVLKPEFSGRTRSTSWLMKPWFFALPGHQQPCYWQCRINGSLSSTRKHFNFHLSIKKWSKMPTYFHVSSHNIWHNKCKMFNEISRSICHYDHCDAGRFCDKSPSMSFYF